MHTDHFERRREPGILLSTDRSLLDLDTVERFIRDTYWAASRRRELIERSIEQSLTFGMYENGRQIGFCRFVTDYATFAWFCDVYVDPNERGRKLGTWMVQSAHEHPAIANIRVSVLGTRDAQELYKKIGYVLLPAPERWMEKRAPTS